MEPLHRGAVRRKQIDRTLREFQNLRRLSAPQRGWIAEVRGIIGMRVEQLAKRMGVAQSTVSAFEHAEASGTITLNTLKRAAEAMDCRLVYAFVPEKSFEELVQKQALRAARNQVGLVGYTMSLEEQQPGKDAQDELIGEYAEQLARYLPRDLWEEDA